MECLVLLPDRLGLFDMIYAARFRRLREQFRLRGPLDDVSLE